MDDGKSKRRAANRRTYQRSKARSEAALLRLELGGLARLDACCGAAGLSRSAFVSLSMLPLAEAVSARSSEIESARARSGQSLAAFLARAIELGLAEAGAPPSPSQGVADEFAALFSGGLDAVHRQD